MYITNCITSLRRVLAQTSKLVLKTATEITAVLQKYIRSSNQETPVPPGAVKFSHSARLSHLNIRICDSDFDIVNAQLSGLEVDFLFRANERFVFRAFLSSLSVEHVSDVTLYSKVS